MNSFELPSRQLPPELLDAFNHDPSSIIGSTRGYRGWRAVEEIHARMSRQRETFRIFMSVARERGIIVDSTSWLDEPLVALFQSLDALEGQIHSVSASADQVTEVLGKTKSIHATVKAEYNDTLSHTSVIYPEVSRNRPFPRPKDDTSLTPSSRKSLLWKNPIEIDTSTFGTLP